MASSSLRLFIFFFFSLLFLFQFYFLLLLLLVLRSSYIPDVLLVISVCCLSYPPCWLPSPWPTTGRQRSAPSTGRMFIKPLNPSDRFRWINSNTFFFFFFSFSPLCFLEVFVTKRSLRWLFKKLPPPYLLVFNLSRAEANGKISKRKDWCFHNGFSVSIETYLIFPPFAIVERGSTGKVIWGQFRRFECLWVLN